MRPLRRPCVSGIHFLFHNRNHGRVSNEIILTIIITFAAKDSAVAVHVGSGGVN